MNSTFFNVLLLESMGLVATLLGVLFLTRRCHGITEASQRQKQPNLHRRAKLHTQGSQRYRSIISFGDSLAHTGNYVYYVEDRPLCGNLPYGDTYFHQATGRCSEGRLMIDFLVVGVNALNASFFERNNISILTNYSLGVQLGWFQKVIPFLCRSPSRCQEMLKDTLFLVREIGQNDINYPLISQWRTVQYIRPIIPKAITANSSAINLLISKGAIILVVPGVFPIGCSPFYLTNYQSQKKDDYDPSTGCLKWLNKLARYQNHLLQKELNHLTKIHSHVKIIYVDCYNLANEMYRSPEKYGFVENVLPACCGGGGPYNVNLMSFCGFPGSTTCLNPSEFVH